MFKRIIFLFWGLFLYSLGIVMTIKGNLGTGPWDALHLGITNYLPLTMGQVSQLTGIVVILLGWTLGMKPGWGTIANMYFIGLFIDLLLGGDWVGTPETWLGRLVILLGGVLVIGWASYFYLSAALGAGPRDGFMVGSVQKTGWPVWKMRTLIEASVTVLGYFLGGPIGVGTLIVAFTLGPSIQWAFSVMGARAQDIRHDGLLLPVWRAGAPQPAVGGAGDGQSPAKPAGPPAEVGDCAEQ
ncbi:MAG TPA: membrane protein [Selenomonadales bacterium]|nr:membrane protein [Selenomonadales bacterium]